MEHTLDGGETSMVFGSTMEDDDDMMIGNDGCTAVIWNDNDDLIKLLQCMYGWG